MTLDEYLAGTAADQPVPGAASAAAVAVAVGAALVANVARRSRGHWEDAGGVVAQAEALRTRAMSLAETSADAYRTALSLLEPHDDEGGDTRDYALGSALSAVASLVLRLGEAAVDVAELGAFALELGDQRVRAEAVGAILLAEAGARSVSNIVALNLAVTRDDARAVRARMLADAASTTARRAMLVA